MNIVKDIFSGWLKVDYRTLGIYRILLGLVCFIDIFRRLPYIEVFYTNNGVAPNQFMSDIASKYSTKAFSLLSSLGSTYEVSIFFYIALLFSFFLMIGYKTKVSHIITMIAVLSIHNRLIILENGADLVLNNFLIWSIFLPLGKRFSIDRMRYLLTKHKDNTPRSLNSGSLVASNEPKNYWGLAYFACLLQLAFIYFFNFINKTGTTWEQGTSVYYFYQLDNFLTPFGNFIKEFSLMPLWLSKLLTYSTIYLEMLAPILILIPIYTLWLRRFSFIALIGFHIVIGISMYIGMFSWIMVAALVLLLSATDIDLLKKWLSKLSSGPFIIFYDSDCGFCHQTARIIRRLDLFENITWAGKDWEGEKPDNLNKLSDTTIVVWDQKANKTYTRHLAFSKIIESLPFGFLLSWLMRIPGLSHFFGYTYDIISKNRISISKLFGYAGCDISKKHSKDAFAPTYDASPYSKGFQICIEGLKTVCVVVLILAATQYALVKNKGFRDWLEERDIKPFRHHMELNQISKFTRMIQNWNMFSPTTPRSFQWVIIEATLNDKNRVYDEGEPFIDKKNGVYDVGEEFTDKGNTIYDFGEPFIDKNGNGQYDLLEEFTDQGNGVYDEGEPFIDKKNGVYDEGEDFTDMPTKIDLQSGRTPVYDKLSYCDTYSNVENNQFWRKYYTRIAKKSYKKYLPQLEKTILNSRNPIKPYDDLNQDGIINNKDRIVSISVYKLKKSVLKPEDDRAMIKRVIKTKLDLSGSSGKRSNLKKKVK